MMVMVRIFPRGRLEKSWKAILDNLNVLSDPYCIPLYLSQREDDDFMTLIYDVTDVDCLADIVVKNIPSLLHPKKTRTITLLKPAFFPAPRDRPQNLERYQVAVRGRPEELENIFNYILHLEYPSDAFPTYAAYSFGEDDILTSMLSTSKTRVDQFLRANLGSQKGVMKIDIGHIDRSKRVAPAEMWKRYRGSRSPFRLLFEEYDFLYPDVLHGAEDAPV